MKRKHKIATLSGGSFRNNEVAIARAVNDNAEVLKKAVQKIEELSKEVEELKELRGEHVGK